MLTREKSTWIAAAMTLSAVAVLAVSYASVVRADVPASIKNIDQKTYLLSVEEDGKTREIQLGPNQSVADLCGTECLMSVDDDPEPYQILAADKIQIQNGELTYQDDGSEEQTSDENASPDHPQPEAD